MPNVRIKRAPLWQVEVGLVLKDGRAIARTNHFRFDPTAEEGSMIENDPLDKAMDDLFNDPEISALNDADVKAQLTEFSMRIRRA